LNSLGNVRNQYTHLTNITLSKAHTSTDLQFEFAQARLLIWQKIGASDLDVIRLRFNDFMVQNDIISALVNDFEANILASTTITEQHRSELLARISEVNELLVGYRNTFDEQYSYILATGDMSRNVPNAWASWAVGEINILLDSLEADAMAIAEFETNSADQFVTYSFSMLVSVLVILVVISVFIATLIIKDLTKSINTLKEASGKIASGDLSVVLRTNSKNELGELSNSIADMVDVFGNLASNINTLTSELSEGNIDYRINEKLFVNDYKTVAAGVNESVSSLVTDITNILTYLNDYGDGNFESVMPKLAGKKIIINQSLEQLQSNLKRISTDINSLANSASSGDLNINIDENRYKGDWQKVALALNSLVIACAEPIKEIDNVFAEIARGNFATSIKGSYKGDFDNIKKSANYSISTIQGYIVEISSTLQHIANKNLVVSLKQNYVGDFISIRDSINGIISDLGSFVNEVNNSSLQVSANASQISSSNLGMAESAAEQAATVQSLVGSVQDIFKETKETTENANKTSHLALVAKQSAFAGNEDMKKMLVSMQEINDASESISKIIKVIDDIAFQTNLLALNAAVEAARAGEHGKGFAVVAEEVRDLAGRSKNAAAETSQLIATSMEKTASGSKVANDTADALNSIVEQITNMYDLISNVANASSKQSESLEGVNSSIAQISDVTKTNTAISQETAASTEELFSQTELLKNLISTFNIPKK